MSTERPSKRARSAVACRRCKHRKQRCDNAFPTCSNCLSAAETCSYESKVHPPDYVESLEQRVAELEKQLQAKEKHLAPSQIASTADLESSPASGHDGAAGNGFEMLSSPSFFGTSSGYHLAKAVHAAIRSPSTEIQGRPGSTTPYKREAALPDAALGRQLIQVYLSKVHSKHPFLSPRRILHLHQTREAVRASSSMQGNHPARLDSFMLCMVYTIGARYHQLSQNEYPCSPDAYYAAAMEDVECLFQSSGLESLEGMLLLVIYQLRSSKPTEIWSLLGITMRQAVNLGLHRRFNGSLIADQRRKLIFWTIYMLERSIARTMGRPMSISDRDIDVDLPADADADIDNEGDMRLAFEQHQQPSTMSAVIHLFRLTRVESKIYSSVHRVDRPVTEIPIAKINRLRHLLEQWREDIPLYVLGSQHQERTLVHYYATSTYHILHYYLALLLLLLPRLTTLPSTHLDFKTCIASAS